MGLWETEVTYIEREWDIRLGSLLSVQGTLYWALDTSLELLPNPCIWDRLVFRAKDSDMGECYGNKEMEPPGALVLYYARCLCSNPDPHLWAGQPL